nr:hypothetical protein [uncultured Devosia sp.]
MSARVLKPLLLALFLLAAAVGGFFYWFYEAPRASGPLSQALLERFDPSEGQQVVNDVLAAHMDVGAPVDEQRTTLESNGFDCATSLVHETGAQLLTCRRPIEGRRYCDSVRYVAYETAVGDIIQSLGATTRVSNRDRMLGRCSYTPPSPED